MDYRLIVNAYTLYKHLNWVWWPQLQLESSSKKVGSDTPICTVCYAGWEVHYFNVERYVWTVLSYHPCLFSLLFADLLSLHLVTFLMFLFLFMSLFLAADACLSWSLPSITEQQVCPHRLPQKMYAVLAPKLQMIQNKAISLTYSFSVNMPLLYTSTTARHITVHDQFYYRNWQMLG